MQQKCGKFFHKIHKYLLSQKCAKKFVYNKEKLTNNHRMILSLGGFFSTNPSLPSPPFTLSLNPPHKTPLLLPTEFPPLPLSRLQKP